MGVAIGPNIILLIIKSSCIPKGERDLLERLKNNKKSNGLTADGSICSRNRRVKKVYARLLPQVASLIF